MTEHNQGKPCPYHSTIANGMRLFGPRHPCFAVYDPPTVTAPGEEGDR